MCHFAEDPLEVDGFPTSWPLPVPEPESNPTGKSAGGGSIYLLIFFPREMQVAPSVAHAQTIGDGSFSGCLVADEPIGRTFPAPRPHAVLPRGWHRRGE